MVRLSDEFPEGAVGERRLSGDLEPGMVLARAADFRVMEVLPE